MDSLDAEDMIDLFTADYNIRTKFKDVYAVDEIPKLKSDSLVVVNLDPSNMPGSHWTVIYNKEGLVIEYFDSRGMKPPGSIAKYYHTKKNAYIVQGVYNNIRQVLVDYFVCITVFMQAENAVYTML